jgi:hypothetical protein
MPEELPMPIKWWAWSAGLLQKQQGRVFTHLIYFGDFQRFFFGCAIITYLT